MRSKTSEVKTEVKSEKAKITEKPGKRNEEYRYRLEEDETSIYEYDIDCLNERIRRGVTKS